MGKFENEARQYVDRIRHYYDHAGSTGYSQAEYFYQELSNLISRAHKSKRNKSDAVVIKQLCEAVEPLMQEMKVREEEYKHSGD